jgi:hypothetical protein
MKYADIQKLHDTGLITGEQRQKIAQVVTPGISGWLTTVAAPVAGLAVCRT